MNSVDRRRRVVGIAVVDELSGAGRDVGARWEKCGINGNHQHDVDARRSLVLV